MSTERGIDGPNGCERARGTLAVRALGHPDPLDAALDDHLLRCATCRAELAELTDTAAAASRADPDAPSDDGRAPSELRTRILTRIGIERARRSRRRWAAVAAAAILLVSGAGVLLARRDTTSTEAASVTLTGTGTGGASGTATLVGHAWGTEIVLSATGLHDGEVYWLWLTDATGARVAAGTVTGTGEPVEAVLASALPTAATRRIWLTDDADAVVLDASVPPAPPPG